jgi:hypothetical protein
MNAKTVTDEQAKNLCKMGQGDTCCAFLVAGRNGFACAKGTDMAGHIHYRLAEGTMNAKGNNCSGPPHFTPNQQ